MLGMGWVTSMCMPTGHTTSLTASDPHHIAGVDGGTKLLIIPSESSRPLNQLPVSTSYPTDVASPRTPVIVRSWTLTDAQATVVAMLCVSGSDTDRNGNVRGLPGD